MAIDPRIALGIQPLQLQSPLETAGQAMQLQALQQRGQLGALQLQQAQQAAQQQAAVRDLAASAGGDMKKIIKGLYDRGMVDMAMGLEAKLAEREKNAVGLQTDRAKLAGERTKLLGGAFKFLGDNPSDERILSTLGGFVQRGELPKDVAEQFAGDLLRLPPQQRSQALVNLARTPEQFAALYAPKIEKIDDGQTISFGNVNPLAGPTVGPVQRQMTPGEVATDRRGQQSNAIAAGNLRVAQDRLALDRAAPRGVPFEGPNGLVLVDPRSGTSRPVVDAAGAPLPAKLTESAKKEIDSIDAQAAAVTSAIESVRKTPSAFSMGRGLATLGGTITESLAGRTDTDEERKARAFVYNNVSKVINERAGAAQSAQELARLRSFLPAETDGPEQVVSKLEAFNDYLATQRQAYSTPRNQRPAAGAAPATPEAPQAAPSWNSLPMPREVPEDAIVRDTQTGQRFRRRGSGWEPLR
ncbi:MAG: hypothetical protein KF822_09505 [Steroidobacteraceae bacterium]|nr:hypothetical protein [Steroidobacteraceae bacterium]